MILAGWVVCVCGTKCWNRERCPGGFSVQAGCVACGCLLPWGASSPKMALGPGREVPFLWTLVGLLRLVCLCLCASSTSWILVLCQAPDVHPECAYPLEILCTSPGVSSGATTALMDDSHMALGTVSRPCRGRTGAEQLAVKGPVCADGRH